MVEKRNDNLIQGWQYHPDGNFGKPVATTGNPTKTDDSDKDLSKNEEYVDLGLPSGTKWAKCDVGANSEEKYGDYYNFDEAVELFKNRDDRMPSKGDIEELLIHTEHLITRIGEIRGMKLVSIHNGNSIFIPFSGTHADTRCCSVDTMSSLWTSDHNDYGAMSMCCNSDGYSFVTFVRKYDKCILRPIKR